MFSYLCATLDIRRGYSTENTREFPYEWLWELQDDYFLEFHNYSDTNILILKRLSQNIQHALCMYTYKEFFCCYLHVYENVIHYSYDRIFRGRNFPDRIFNDRFFRDTVRQIAQIVL